jgi:D-beta-D-heptose 7-phosphate kinase/D-beta-D-heptose 1-phosphate adenosyltransferase
MLDIGLTSGKSKGFIMKKVFVNGTFDVLHPGHIAMITYASNSGEELVIAIDSDRRVKEKKGSDRPINNEDIRAKMLFHIKGVDRVVIFDTDGDLRDLVKEYEPDVMIVGSDYENKDVIGSEYAKELKFFKRDERYSSTKIINNIANRR